MTGGAGYSQRRSGPSLSIQRGWPLPTKRAGHPTESERGRGSHLTTVRHAHHPTRNRGGQDRHLTSGRTVGHPTQREIQRFSGHKQCGVTSYGQTRGALCWVHTYGFGRYASKCCAVPRRASAYCVGLSMTASRRHPAITRVDCEVTPMTAVPALKVARTAHFLRLAVIGPAGIVMQLGFRELVAAALAPSGLLEIP
jgi:hypothetical protein